MGHNHHHHNDISPADARYREVRNITLWGAVVNLVLSIGKIFFGFVGQSQSLIADGIHSLSDLASDGLVLIAAKHGSQDADEEHPYGHGRIETLATVALGIFLIAVAVGISVDAVHRLFEPEELLNPGFLALSIALISVAAKEALYIYTMRVAKKLNSDMLKANAWHHRSDAISTVIVVIGIIGSMAGLSYLDAIAAIGVGLMIVKIGWDLCAHSIRELIDTALDSEHVDSIKETIAGVDGVKTLHMLRTRRMGGSALVDVHLQVNPEISVSEGHQISEAVRHKLLAAHDEVSDVLVHIDPEDDELAKPCDKLPLRHIVIERLYQHWSGIAETEKIEKITLHYLDGEIHAEVCLPLAIIKSVTEAEALAAQFSAAAHETTDVTVIRIAFTR